MTGDDGGSEILLATKLFPPSRRAASVVRPRLLQALRRACEVPLSLVVAPAGWGKTTVVMDWLEHDRVSAAWVSLDVTENDPKRFWSYLLAAVRKVAPDVGEQAQRRLRAAGSEIVRDVLPRLVNDLADRPQDLVVLDDLHAVNSQEVYESLALLLTRGPPTLHLVVTSRTDPPLPVSRLRLHGGLVELRAEQLRFTGEESGRLLNELWVAACPDEADDFFAFMTTAAAASVGPRQALQIMFGVGGEHDLSERELAHLAGWRDSRPVRVGNGAWQQQQIDVYGELLGAAHRLADQISGMDEDMRRFLVALADTAAVRWRETDQGIWEVRGEPRHFLYSKVMCWVALDRAIALGDRLGAADRIGEWKRAQDEIHETVLREGWSETASAFTQSFGSDDLDASNLMLPIVGFLPADDPRVIATVDAIADRLTDDRGLVYRYRTAEGDNSDGLAGEEGTFLLCTFWLVQALALAGRTEQARDVFGRAARYVNDVGLLAEEIDQGTGELLGNFPQAFSHIGLINAAYSIAEAEQRKADR